MKNRMQEIAEMLGVEIGEEFNVINQDCNLIYGCPYKLTHEGCELQTGDTASSILMQLLNGNCSVVKKPWKPKYGEWFWIVKSTGRVISIKNLGSESDAGLIKFGNCFKTEADAEAHADEMKKKIMEVFKE